MKNYEIVEEIINYFESNIHERITTVQLNQKFNYSTAHLHRLFVGMVGLSPIRYFKKRKLSEATRMIIESDYSLSYICFEYGYENQEVFSRAIKKEFGQTPQTLRTESKFNYYHKYDFHQFFTEQERNKTMNCEIVKLGLIELKGEEYSLNQHQQVEENQINKIINNYKQEHQDAEDIYSVYEYNLEDLSKADEEINYKYFIGSNKKGSVDKVIKPSKYAKFTYNIEHNTINNQLLSDFVLDGQPVKDVYDYIDGVWLPKTSYELSEAYDLELRRRSQANIIEYYISIK